MKKLVTLILLGLILYPATVTFGWQDYYRKRDYHYDRRCKKYVTCETVRSCREALFYLDKCEAYWLDRNGNGIPCECGVCIHMNPRRYKCKEYWLYNLIYPYPYTHDTHNWNCR